MELIQDPIIIKEFEDLIINHIARVSKGKEIQFVGGLPITLERKHMTTLLQKENDAFKYTVTQKVDGTRMLMFIGPDFSPQESSIKSRSIVFIDRKLNYWTLRNDVRDTLPYYSGGKMLIDGELVFFDADGVSHQQLDVNYVKGISFMAFDILYGPTSVEVEGFNIDRKLHIGQEGSMVVPLDGKLRTEPWTYMSRYNILYNLIIPNPLNNEIAKLTETFVGKNWFNIELKPIYFLGELKAYPNLYTEHGRGTLQKDLNSLRGNFYNNILANKYSKTIDIFTKRSIKLDGLIFTAKDTLYTIGAWNKPGTTQYKWKPDDEQSIDFMVKKTNYRVDTFRVVNLEVYSAGAKGPVQFKYNGKPAVSLFDSADFRNIIDKSIGEFVIENGKFKFKSWRTDKDSPNAYHVANNVMNSIQYPVDINDLLIFLNFETANKRALKRILEYSTKESLIRCIQNNKEISLIPSEQKELIEKQMIKFFHEPETELEFRVGKIGGNFNPDLTEQNYNNVLLIMNNTKWSNTLYDYVDVINKDIRTRYIYSKDFCKYILLESIQKQRLSNIDLDLNYIFGFDIRSSLSSEIRIKEYLTQGTFIRKLRSTYREPNGLFDVDITQIQLGKFEERLFKPNKNKTFQIEIEIKKKNTSIDSISKFLSYLLSKL